MITIFSQDIIPLPVLLEEERAFIKAVTQGLIDVKEGKEQRLEDVKKKLGM